MPGTSITNSATPKVDHALGSLVGGIPEWLQNEGVADRTTQLTADFSHWQWNEDAVAISALAIDKDASRLATDLAVLGMHASSVHGQVVTGFLPVGSISALTDLESLRFAQPIFKPMTHVGQVTSGGDLGQRSQIVREFEGLTGKGVRVGVISDSYDKGPDGSAEADVDSGDLPGVG
jgi:hypothetical protein